MKSPNVPSKFPARQLAAAVLLSALLLVLLSYWYYQVEFAALIQEKHRTLGAVGELKSKQIQQWRKERLAEGRRAAQDSLTIQSLVSFLGAPNDPLLRSQLEGSLKEEVTEYANLLLFNPDGELIFSTGDAPKLVPATTEQALRAALVAPEAVMSNFFCSPKGTVHIDVAAAVRDATGRILGVLVLRLHVSDYLVSIIQFWPAASPTAEVILSQREGDEVVIVNALRQGTNVGMEKRFPLTRTELSGVQAALGKAGRFEGYDYRGAKVLADLRGIPGAPWFISTKVDMEELRAEVRSHTGVVTLIGGLVILLAAASVASLFRKRQAGLLKNIASMGLRNQVLLESASDGIHILDERGNVVETNASFCRMLGYPREEVLRLNVADWDSQWAGEDLLAKVRELLAHPPGHPVLFETLHRRKDGSLRDVEINAVAVKLEGHNFLYASTRDITERKHKDEELQKLRAAVEQSANTIVITDPGGTIEYVNPAFEKTTGYAAAEAVGQTPRMLKSGEQGEAFYRELWGTITSGKTWRGQFHNRHKDGSLYWESATISPVLNARGETMHFIAVKENITDRKSLEGRLSEALLHAESANRAKSEFLAVMSHELRTPLNGVLGFAELLSYTQLDNEQRDYAQTITDSGKHLLAVVNDILDFSSIEKGHLEIHPAPLAIAELIESSIPAARKAAVDKKLAFHCELAPGVPDRITGDARRIRQILINLLGNAVKFTSAGSVVLRVAPASAACGRATLDFAVEDTGIGISGETLGRLFQPFAQADTTMNRPFEGSGLGLAISKRLAEAMAGTISVVSTPGRGSTFTLRIPMEVPASPASLLETGVPPVLPGGRCAVSAHLFPPSEIGDGTAAIPPATQVPHTGGTPLPPESSRPLPTSERLALPPPERGLVLVVEDDPDNSLLAGKMIESLGFRAEFAAHGAEAVAAFAPEKFYAILMDMRMPVMDGLEATRSIRALESDSRVPIVALTANVMPGDRERCLAAGMDDFLSKPFTRAALASTLARAGDSLLEKEF